MKKFLILLILIAIIGCSMNFVNEGDKIKVDYVGTLSDGSIFDTSIEIEAKKSNIFDENRPYAPLEFVVGGGQMIKGFDDAVVGMKIGQEKIVELGPNDAYGPYQDNLVVTVSPEVFASEDQMVVGNSVMFTTTDGRTLRGLVKEIKGDNVLVDLNHPLAGKSLTFRIFIRDVVKQ